MAYYIEEWKRNLYTSTPMCTAYRLLSHPYLSLGPCDKPQSAAILCEVTVGRERDIVNQNNFLFLLDPDL